MDKIKVLIVDDSAVVRQVISDILRSDPGIELLGAAPDPLFAMERMKRRWPDVVVLDIEMPRMDGLTFLRKLMGDRPTPVVICSSLAQTGADATMQALAAGAVDVFPKPQANVKNFLAESGAQFIAVIKAAAQAKVQRLPASPAKERPAPPKPAPKLSADVVLPPGDNESLAHTEDKVVAIGTSTGGTQALEEVLTALPAACPGIVVVQHMPEKFTAAFAARLNGLSRLEVKEAADGDRVVPGRALIAPGGRHLLVRRDGTRYLAEVRDGPLVSRHRPSVDVLFRSVAKYAGRNALGIIMTGMGDDGANGLLEMRHAGARTIAQDEATSLVYGMPKEAVLRGAVNESLALTEIAGAIMRFWGKA